MLLHIMFRVWVNYLTEAKDAREQAEFEKHLWETLGKHEHVLDKALMHWANSHFSLLLHTLFWVRMDNLAEAMDAREAAGVRIAGRRLTASMTMGWTKRPCFGGAVIKA